MFINKAHNLRKFGEYSQKKSHNSKACSHIGHIYTDRQYKQQTELQNYRQPDNSYIIGLDIAKNSGNISFP